MNNANTMTENSTEIVNLTPESDVRTVHLGDAQLQRGYVYRCDPTGDGNEIESEDGEPGAFGYHGNDTPPCAAEYLCDSIDSDGYLVISTEEDPSEIVTVDGWALAPADLEAGQLFADEAGWSVVVVKKHLKHEYTVAGSL